MHFIWINTVVQFLSRWEGSAFYRRYPGLLAGCSELIIGSSSLCPFRLRWPSVFKSNVVNADICTRFHKHKLFKVNGCSNLGALEQMNDDSTICTIYLYAFAKIVLQSCTSPFSILSKKLVTYMQAICNLQVNFISVLLCALTDQNSFCLDL